MNLTLDTLAFDLDLRIQREVLLDIHMNLMAAPGTTLADITTVLSIPVAVAQVRQFLRRELPDAELRAANSTAEAAQTISTDRPVGVGAVAPALAAELYGLDIARRLTAERVMQLDHGDRVGGMQVLQLSLAEPPHRWSQAVPKREIERAEVMRDSIARVRFLRDAAVLLGQLADPEGRDDIDGTDILSTLHDVAAELQAYPDHDATLYLFSDMLQSNRVIDMEGLRLMPPDDWVATAKADGRLPNLEGLCVVVVGARVDTPAAQRVKAFWKDYFAATGATLLDGNYVLRPVRLPEHPCD